MRLGCPHPESNGVSGYFPVTYRDMTMSGTDGMAGLGALPGPTLMDELLRDAQSYVDSMTDMNMAALQNKIIEATALAQSKQQGAIVKSLESYMAKLQSYRAQYSSVQTSLQSMINELRLLKERYEAKQASIGSVILATARLALIAGPTFSLAKYVVNTYPGFEAAALNVIGKAQAAQATTPAIPLTAAIPQSLMWAAIFAGIVLIAPKLLKSR